MKEKKYKGPPHEIAMTTETGLWNDSCSVSEPTYAMENGAVGATANPVIVGEALGMATIAFNRDDDTVTADYVISTFRELLDIAAAA